jgi:hypothetical protein
MCNSILSKSLTELLSKFLTFDITVFTENYPFFLEKRIEALDLIIDKLNEINDLEEINNASFLIGEVFVKYNTMNGSQEILNHLLEDKTIEKFFDILQAKSNGSTNAVAFVLSNIVAYYLIKYGPKNTQNSEDEGTGNTIAEAQANPSSVKLPDDIPLIKRLADNIPHIAKYLAENNSEQFKSSYGKQIVPLGSSRLKMIELVLLSLKANNQTIVTQLIESEIIKTVLDLFIKYEWNNLLHNLTEKIINQILDGTFDELKEYIFTRCQLVNFMLDCTKDINATMSKGTLRKGWLGQIFRLANKLVDSKDAIVVKYLKDNQDWSNWVETTLKDTNELYKKHLGGKDPRAKIEDDDDNKQDIPLDIPKIIFQKFSKFFHNTNNMKDKNDKDNDDDVDDDADDDKREDEKNADSDILKDLDSDDNGKHMMRFGGNHDDNNEDSNADKFEDAIEAPPPRGRISFGRKHKNEEEIIKEEKEEVEWFSEPLHAHNLHHEAPPKAEPAVANEFSDNNFWRPEKRFNIDDILAELL